MTLPPAIAAKAAKETADPIANAIAGDIYVRRWSTQKTKKSPKIQHELRINALSGAIIAGGLAATAVGGALALWLTQQKLSVQPYKDATITIIKKLADTHYTVYLGRIPVARYTLEELNPLDAAKLHAPKDYYLLESSSEYKQDRIVYIYRFRNEDKSSYRLDNRKGFSVFSPRER